MMSDHPFPESTMPPPPPTTNLHDAFSADFEHGLRFTKSVLDASNPLLEEILGWRNGGPRPGMIAVIDSGLHHASPDLAGAIEARFAEPGLPELRETIIVPGGEAAKNDSSVVETVLSAVDRHHIDRRSLIAVFGGGAVIDAVGFAASTAHRGVRLVRFASTVLAQLDAAIGVKNGINRFGKKNFVGCFDVPVAVVCDEEMLETLSDRDWRSGFSEAVKIACLKDEHYFELIEKHADRIRERDPQASRPVIHRCAELHLHHITRGGDPFERAEARPLDFGHWAAHRLESITDFSTRHGEAVSIGIALDTMYSHLAGRIGRSEADRVIEVLKRLGLPVHHQDLHGESILEGIQEFREHLGGRLTVTLLDGIGHPVDVHEIDLETVARAADLLA